MKYVLITIIAVSIFTGCEKAQQTSQQEYQISGKWLGKGYTCWDDDGILVEMNEFVSIKQNKNQVIATKITGDNCVGEGEITWKGEITGDKIVGVWIGFNRFTKEKSEFPAKFTIESNDYLFSMDDDPIEFHRVKEQELTPEEVSEALSMRLGKWENIKEGEREPFEVFTGKWKEEGESIEVVGKTVEGPDYYQFVSYKDELGSFIEDFTFDDGSKLIRHSVWNKKGKSLESKVIASESLPNEYDAVLYMKRTGVNEITGKFEVIANGKIIHSINNKATRVQN